MSQQMENAYPGCEYDDPVFCPYCGSIDIVEIGRWNAQSTLEDHNTAALTEWQCFNCSNRSFWI